MLIRVSGGETLKVYPHEEGLCLSVTQVTGLIKDPPWVARWRDRVGLKVANQTREESLEFGSRVHAIAQQVAERGCVPGECRCPDAIDEDLVPFHTAVVNFLAVYVDEVLEIEHEFKLPDIKLGGTTDLYVKLKTGENAIVDYKASKSLSQDYALQTIAYMLLAHANGLEVDKRLLVRLKKEAPGEWEVKAFDDHEGDGEAFVGLLRYAYWHYRNKLAEAEHRAGYQANDIEY